MFETQSIGKHWSRAGSLADNPEHFDWFFHSSNRQQLDDAGEGNEKNKWNESFFFVVFSRIFFQNDANFTFKAMQIKTTANHFILLQKTDIN